MALRELIGSREEEFSIDAASATRILMCDWLERPIALTLVKSRYPEPHGMHMKCRSVSLAPVGWNRALRTYKKCRITARYNYDRNTDAEEDSWEFSVEVIARDPGDADSYGSPTHKITKQLMQRLPLEEMVMTRVLTPAQFETRETQVMNNIGKVNTRTFKKKAPGTVLFEGVSAQEEKEGIGGLKVRVTWKFVYRPTSWLKEWNPSSVLDVRWETVDPPLYESADLRFLVPAKG